MSRPAVAPPGPGGLGTGSWGGRARGLCAPPSPGGVACGPRSAAAPPSPSEGWHWVEGASWDITAPPGPGGAGSVVAVASGRRQHRGYAARGAPAPPCPGGVRHWVVARTWVSSQPVSVPTACWEHRAPRRGGRLELRGRRAYSSMSKHTTPAGGRLECRRVVGSLSAQPTMSKHTIVGGSIRAQPRHGGRLKRQGEVESSSAGAVGRSRRCRSTRPKLWISAAGD